MAEPSSSGAESHNEKAEVLPPRIHRPTRGWLITGLVLVALFAGGLSWGLGELRDEPSPGRLFYADADGIYERDLRTREEERVATLPDATVASVSPDARWVAYLSDGRLILTGLDDEADVEIVVADRLTAPLGWTPDGRLVAGELLSDGDLVAVDPEGARELLFSGMARGVVPVFLDDERFAIARTGKEFVIVEDRKPVATAEGFPLAASADGAELLLQRGDDVVVAKVDGSHVDEARKVFAGRARRAVTSRTGFVAITGEDDEGNDGVWVFEGGTDVRRVYDKAVDWLGWSAESSHLLYARKGVIYAQRLPDGEPKPVSRKGVDVLPLFSFTVVP